MCVQGQSVMVRVVGSVMVLWGILVRGAEGGVLGLKTLSGGGRRGWEGEEWGGKKTY